MCSFAGVYLASIDKRKDCMSCVAEVSRQQQQQQQQQ
jgi:hypothetical protein